jgi:hypothetical protein
MTSKTKKIMTLEEAETAIMKAHEITKVKIELVKTAYANRLILADADLQNKLKQIANELQEIIDGLLLEVAQADLLKAGEKQC